MSLLLTSRSLDLERMDVETLTPESTADILKALETINVWLGGVRATLWHLKRFSSRWIPGQRIRIIDWGTGGADMPRAIVRWGRKQGFKIEIVGVDNNSEIADYARKACEDYPEITIVNEDAIKEPSPQPSPGGRGRLEETLSPRERAGEAPGEGVPFHYAISSLTLHHLTDIQIIDLLKKSDEMASRGIIMNDLKRSARAWAWIWGLSRIGGAHPIVQNDGPLSVKRAFTAAELQALSIKAGVLYGKVYPHFGYRLTLAGEKI